MVDRPVPFILVYWYRQAGRAGTYGQTELQEARRQAESMDLEGKPGGSCVGGPPCCRG
jgi:hypothetical protein